MTERVWPPEWAIEETEPVAGETFGEHMARAWALADAHPERDQTPATPIVMENVTVYRQPGYSRRERRRRR